MVIPGTSEGMLRWSVVHDALTRQESVVSPMRTLTQSLLAYRCRLKREAMTFPATSMNTTAAEVLVT